MDGWQAAQNWAIFALLAAGPVYYYLYKSKAAQKAAPLKEIKNETKKTARKVESAAKKQAPSSITQKSETSSKDNGKNKRKAHTQPTPQTVAAPAGPQNDDDEIDMSTRQFAASMTKAREGVNMKKADSKDTRVKTVKAKSGDSPVLPSGSPRNGDEDVDHEWSHVPSQTQRSAGIDDMLEAAAPGPSALRITAPSKPVKENVNRQAKQEVVETKKQRQNRKKKEDERLAREQAESVRKVQQEQQRRLAREGRGEPARNGVSIPAAPVQNPWSEQNATRAVQLPVKAGGDNTQLLDTFDAESTSSSNADRMSTAATSTTDGPTEVPMDGQQSEDDAIAVEKAIAESERETGWSEVKSSKKTKKISETTGNTTPVAAPVAKASTANTTTKTGSKPNGYQTLKDEGEQFGDPNDTSSWAA